MEHARRESLGCERKPRKSQVILIWLMNLSGSALSNNLDLIFVIRPCEQSLWRYPLLAWCLNAVHYGWLSGGALWSHRYSKKTQMSSNALLVVSATLNKVPLPSSCSAQYTMAWRSSLRNPTFPHTVYPQKLKIPLPSSLRALPSNNVSRASKGQKIWTLWELNPRPFTVTLWVNAKRN